MTRDEKISIILTQLNDNTQLLQLLRVVFKNAIPTVTDELLDQLYIILNPSPSE